MKKVLMLSILIVILAAFFASSHPDGLEKVAQSLGFLDKGIENHSIMTGYTMPFLGEGWLSTAISGILGVLLLLGSFYLIRKLFA